MGYKTILTGTDNGIATITLKRPERLNAWTYRMGRELAEAIATANTSDDVSAIVVTGAGRGFCAGADVDAVFKAQSEQRDSPRQGARTGDWVELVRGSKPIVAAINGAAIGVGLTAEEAQVIGLVDKVVDGADLLKTAHASARAMGENPQAALRLVKQLLTQNVAEGDTRLVQQREIATLTQCYASPEQKEAISAFLEKRDPDFRKARSL